ncbi:MAG: hypothetical protein QX199_09060 [Methylococcaceae bacterium]
MDGIKLILSERPKEHASINLSNDHEEHEGYEDLNPSCSSWFKIKFAQVISYTFLSFSQLRNDGGTVTVGGGFSRLAATEVAVA